MARLIDAEPILMKWNTESLGRKEMYDMVKNAPMVDAVPVVRCKDCRHWSEMQNSAGACLRHSVIAGSWWNGTDSTDYCSFAERRNDELQEDNGRCELPCAE